MNFARRIATGAGLSLIDQVVKIASAFILTPMLVAGLGDGPYGVWCVLMAVFAQYGWLDLGLSISFPRFFARALGSKDAEQLRVLAGTGATTFGTVAVISFGITLVVAWLAPGWFPTMGSPQTARGIVLAFGSFLAVQTACQIFQGYLKGQLRYDRIAQASIFKVMLSSCLIWWSLNKGWGLMGIACIHAACGIMECGIMMFFAHRIEPPLLFSYRDFEKSKAVEILKYSFVAYVMMAGQSLRNTMDPIIVAMQAGDAAVTGYALGNRFPVLFVDLAHIVAGGQLLSLFSHYVGSGDKEGLMRQFRIASRACATVAVLGTGMMWLFGLTFLQRWVPLQAEAAWAVMLPAVLPKALYISQTPSMVLLLAMARHKRLAVIDWIAGTINLALSWHLVARMGAPGAAWATCFEQSLVCAFIWPWLASRVAGISFAQIWASLLVWPLLRAVLVLAPCALLLRWARPDYIVLTVIGLVSCTWFVIGTVLVMTRDERAGVLRMLPAGLRARFEKKASSALP